MTDCEDAAQSLRVFCCPCCGGDSFGLVYKPPFSEDDLDAIATVSSVGASMLRRQQRVARGNVFAVCDGDDCPYMTNVSSIEGWLHRGTKETRQQDEPTFGEPLPTG